MCRLRRAPARAEPVGQGSSSEAEEGNAESPSQMRPVTRPSVSDPVQTVAWGGTLPSGRRMVVGGLVAATLGACATELSTVRLARQRLLFPSDAGKR
jgi:hypothetical protein